MKNLHTELKRLFLKLVGLTGTYFIIMDGLGRAQLLMDLVNEPDHYRKIGCAVTVFYCAAVVWCCWRSYADIIRDGDFTD